MAEDKVARTLVDRVDRLRSLRSPWLQLWQDCADYVLPRRSTRFYTSMTDGQSVTDRIFDGTAPWANEQLAAGLHSYLTSSTQRWFKLRTKDVTLMDDEEVVQWLDDCSQRMYNLFNNDRTGFTPMVHELYLDLGALGTGVFYVEEVYDPKLPPIRFCTYHLGESFIVENENGLVDAYYREFKMTARNAYSKWGDKLPPKLVKDATEQTGNPANEYWFVHAIAPNEDFKPQIPRLGGNKPFRSIYATKEEPTTLSIKGYDRFPILAPRWSKISGETYGRAPAMTCMPDIKMVNTMTRTIIMAAQKVVDPPLQLPDEGFLLPIKMSPGGLNFYDASLNPDLLIKPIETRGKIDVGDALLDKRREQIVRSFYVDMMQLQEGPQMTATEVIQRNEDKMRLMAPMVGRLQSEFLNPLIEYVFEVMSERRMFKQPPPQLKGADLSIDYVSPVARAQKMTQLFAFQRMIESIAQIAQIKPQILDRIKEDRVPVVFANMMDAPSDLIRSDRELNDYRAQQNEQAQQTQNSALANQGADTLAKLSKAAPDVAAKLAGGSPPTKKAA